MSIQQLTADFKNNWKEDLLSGFLVSLIALPLSLGIAGASGFPPIMGVLTAIVGGIVVSFFAGSQLTIKGPAAGLIVIVAGSVSELGKGDDILGWKLTLVAIVISGFIQILMGIGRVARLSSYFPVAAIHGMLAAIGIIIISKQILLAEGISPVLLKGKEPLELIEMIPEMAGRIEWHIATIGIVSLLIMFLWPQIQSKKARKIPPAVIVILASIILGRIFHLHDKTYLSLKPLVNPGSLELNFNAGFNFIDNSNIIILTKYIIMLSLIGTIESLLTGKAIDLMDPYKRKSDLNKDISAIGIGNMVSGLFGGLPMISEVARSSANISNGGRTRFANLFHGLSLLIMVLLLGPLVKTIPVAALSGLLIYVGFKLAHPKEFKNMKELGSDQLIVFLVTIITTLITDLLLGVSLGVLTKLIINFADGAKLKFLFKLDYEKQEYEDRIVFKAKSAALFTNWNYFNKHIAELPDTKEIIIDFSNSKLIDHTFLKSIYLLSDDYKRLDKKITLVFSDLHKGKSAHSLSKKLLIQPND
jgi:MFS superfamily sulfate permease-like transporter